MTLGPAATALVAVCTRDRPVELARCLESLLAQTVAIRILVVDSASSGDDTRIVASRFGVEYRRLDRRGLSAARNAALADERASTILFIDDDAVARRDWAQHVLAEFEDPGVAVVTGRILPLSREPVPEGNYEPLPTEGMDARQVFDRTSPSWADETLAGLPGGGANLGVRTASCRGWRGFDERFGRGSAIPVGDENMAFFEIVRHGGRVVYTPDAVVSHPIAASGADRIVAWHRARAAYTAFWLAMLIEVRGARPAALRRLFGRAGAKSSSSRFRPVSRSQSARAALAGMSLYLRHLGRRVASR